jgi:hypothetical protein
LWNRVCQKLRARLSNAMTYSVSST